MDMIKTYKIDNNIFDVKEYINYGGTSFIYKGTVEINNIKEDVIFKFIKSKKCYMYYNRVMEIEAMVKLNEVSGISHIKTFFTLSDSQNIIYYYVIVMDYDPNMQDLFEVCKNFIFNEYEIKCIFKQLLHIIKQIMKRNFVYIDMKIENVLIDITNPLPTIKIIDFGATYYKTDKANFANCITKKLMPMEYHQKKIINYKSYIVWAIGKIIEDIMCSSDITYSKNLNDLVKLCLNPLQKRILLKYLFKHKYLYN